MKNTIMLLLLALFPILSIGQRKPKIKGNRSVTEVREQLPPFNSIELIDNLDVELKKSYGEGYEIIADDNLVDILKFEVIDSTLVISSFYNIMSKKKLEITVNFQGLKAITVKDGKIFSDAMISADEVYLNTFGNAELDVDASGFLANVNAEDNSSMNLNLDVDSLNVDLKHKTDVMVYAVSGAKNINLVDTASLTLEGTTETLLVAMEGNTKLKADKLEAAETDLMVRESGFARINSYRSFTLKSSGNSKIHLYGNPKITIDEFFDTSQLIKKED